MTISQVQVVETDTFSAMNVIKYIDRLNAHKSAGADKIHPQVIKKCRQVFATILSPIFQESFKCGVVPFSWKEANITPIFKKGQRPSPANYRPVSLTAVPCKIMERMLRDVMLKHLMANNLVVPEQHGFVLSKSCVTNLLETVDTISHSIDKGNIVILILLDFAKAFDKVCHSSLIVKLETYGFDNSIINWVRDFLTNRKQRVVIGDNSSDWKLVTSGVPQGSVLAPLLFVIFINDMPKVVNHIIKLFADDSKLIGIIKNQDDVNLLQMDLDNLVKWANDWRMMFHPDKCKAMSFDRSKKGNSFDTTLSMETSIQGTRHILESSVVERDLGILITPNLKFEAHAEHAAAKASSVMGQLKRTFNYWTKHTFKILFSTYVRPHLEYAATVWSPYRKKDISTIEKIQRRATKTVPELRNLSYHDRLIELNLTTLEERRLRGDLIQFFKWYTGSNIINLQNNPKRAAALTRSGPASGLRMKPHCFSRQDISTCALRENFFTHRTIPIWNSLPVNVVASKSINMFKIRLDKHLSIQRSTTNEVFRLGSICY